MADEDAPAVEQTAVAQDVAAAEAHTSRSSRRRASAQPSVEGNCVGELEQLPDVEGTTYHEYRCKSCGQTVHVGLEHLDSYGLPPEHHKREEEK